MKTPPGQMLLLFLTLVLLGGSANGSQQSQSIGITEPPEDYRFVISEEGQLISEIRIQIGTSGYLTSIQVQYGNDWSERYGTMEGSLEEVILNADEYIIQVDVSNGNTECLQD